MGSNIYLSKIPTCEIPSFETFFGPDTYRDAPQSIKKPLSHVRYNDCSFVLPYDKPHIYDQKLYSIKVIHVMDTALL